MADASKHSTHPTQRRYPAELRERATRMVLETVEQTGERQGVVGRVARKLGVGTETLRGWVHQAARGCRARRSDGSPSWNGRTVSCAGRMRSSNQQRLSSGRSSTADRRGSGLHRRPPRKVGGRADLCSAGGRPIHVGLVPATRAKTKRTTVPAKRQSLPADLVKRNFKAPEPNCLWVNDLTYVPIWSGFAYTAFVVDAFSRRIVGWRTSASLETGVALDALEMAIWSRRGVLLDGLVHHSDYAGVYVKPRSLDVACVGGLAD